MRRLLWLLSIAAILLPLNLVYAQTPRVVPNTPITVEWHTDAGHVMSNGLQWRALVDGQITKNFVGADLTVTPDPSPGTGQTFRATIPGVQPGSHTLIIREYCCSPVQQADSPALTFTAEVTPTPPTLPRIIAGTLALGTITMPFRLQIDSDSAVQSQPVVAQVLTVPGKQ